ncbi:MAG: hypothetical protein ACLRFE_01775 [Clostridia bacterium]
MLTQDELATFRIVKDETDGYYYNNKSYLINNIGVLSLINEIPNTLGLYFELEVDIQMIPAEKDKNNNPEYLVSDYKGGGEGELLAVGPQIGSGTPFQGVFNSSCGADYSDTNEWGKVENVDIYYNFIDNTLASETGDMQNSTPLSKVVTPKVITNLNGSLFDNITSGALITNINLNNSYVKETSAAVVKTVSKYDGEDDLEPATLYKVLIGDNSEENESFAFVAQGNSSGFVYSIVEGAELNMHSIANDSEGTAIKAYISGVSMSVAGVIYTNAGTINVAKSFINTNFGFFKPEGNNDNNVAGFVYTNTGAINFIEPTVAVADMDDANPSITISTNGPMSSISGFVNDNSGNIYGGVNEEYTVFINIAASQATTLSGFVETMSGGAIGGFDITFLGTGETDYIVTNFAGVVYNLTGGSLGYKVNEEDVQAQLLVDENVDRLIKVTLPKNIGSEVKTFGGVVNKVSGGALVSVSLEVDGGSLTINTNNNNESQNTINKFYGLIIGSYDSMEAINYTLLNDIMLNVKNGCNVGGIIGVATNGSFNFINEQSNVKTTKVKGAWNVGGFVGNYQASSISMTGEVWPVGGVDNATAFAIIDVSISDETEYGNFGGLFGKFSGDTLQVSDKTNLIVNANKVLNFDDIVDRTKDSYKRLYNGYYDGGSRITITNVGGVVGYFEGSSINNVKNNEQIGKHTYEDFGESKTNKYKGHNLITRDTYEDVFKVNCVGGVIGKANPKSGNCNLITITNATNAGKVYGMFNVGGVIGGSDSDFVIEIELGDNPDTAVTENNYYPFSIEQTKNNAPLIMGLLNVGGLAGSVKSFEYKGVEGYSLSHIFEYVSGIVNVGSIVGSATDKLQIEYLNIGSSVEAEVNSLVVGNINVGGIVGSSKDIEIKGVTLTTKTSVYGSVFDYPYTTKVDEELKTETYFYIPTNIGGVAGEVTNMAKLTNVDDNTFVATDNNFVITNSSIVTIDLNVNNMGNLSNASMNEGDDIIKNIYMDNFDPKWIKYDELDSGIGGLVGCLQNAMDADTVKRMGDVYAPYGINVGGIAGYFGKAPVLFSIGNITTKGNNQNSVMRVAGRIFVGGYVGKSMGYGAGLKTEIPTGEYNDDGSPKTTEVSIDAKQEGFFSGDAVTSAGNSVLNINIQQYDLSRVDGDPNDNSEELETLQGYCIGGVFGYIAGNVYNLKLTADDAMNGEESKIKIFNKSSSSLDSSHIGVLVGRLDGNMENCYVAPELCDAVQKTIEGTKYTKIYTYAGTIKGVIQTPSEYNYGGLVGMLKTSDDVTITGTHYYAFTVDMVQNSKFGNGTSKYGYSDGVLTANAHLTNLANISISISSLTDLYDEDKTGEEDNNRNPMNSNAIGWAKEYTMFRLFAVWQEQDANTGDYLQTLYDAECITEVVSQYTGEENDSEDSNINTACKYSDKILYTIYAPINQTPRLYCEYGIAELKIGFDPDDIIKLSDGDANDNPFEYEKHHQVTLSTNGIWQGKQISGHYETTQVMGNTVEIWVEDTVEGENRGAFWTHLSDITQLNINQKDAIEENEDESAENSWQFTEAFDEEVSEVSRAYQLSFGYTYYKNSNYLGQQGDKYFVFSSVFGSIENLKANDTPYGYEWANEDTTAYSPSGSLFEVTGVPHIPETGEIKDSEAWIDTAVQIVPIVIAIVLCVFQMYHLGLYLVVRTIGQKFLLRVLFTVVVALLKGADALISRAIEIGNYKVELFYSSIYDASQGYLAGTYSRNIGWNKGVQDTYYDQSLILNSKVTGETDGRFRNIFASSITDQDKKGTTMDKWVLINVGYEFDNGDIDNTKFVCNNFPLTYFYYSTTHIIPDDINASSIIYIDNMDDGDIKTLFNKMNVKSLSVPKYRIVDNDIYIISGGEECSRELVKEFSGNSAIGIDDALLTDVSGYSYVIKGIGYDNKLLYNGDTQEQIEKIEKTYNIELTVSKQARHILSEDGSSRGAIKGSDKSLKWVPKTKIRTGDTESLKDFKQNVKIEYVSEKPMDDEYITLRVLDDGKIEIIDKHISDFGLDANTPKGTLLYFIFNWNGSISIDLYPQISLDEGFTVTDTELYFVPSSDEDKVGFQVYRDFGLLYPLTENTGSYSYDAERLDMDNETQLKLAKSIKITIYNITNNPPITNDGDYEKSFEELFIIAEKTLSLHELWSDFELYKDWSISNQYRDLVSNHYSVAGNVLNLLTLNLSHLYDNETFNDKTIYYRPIYGISKDVFNNRYIYSYGTYRLYTRFNYGSGFISETIYQNGDTEWGYVVCELLFPENEESKAMDVIFAESARVTLSAGADVWVYTDYKTKTGRQGAGTINAIIPW